MLQNQSTPAPAPTSAVSATVNAAAPSIVPTPVTVPVPTPSSAAPAEPPPMSLHYVLRNFWFNFAMNVADGSFFGLGMGFASNVSVLPLFFSTLTTSTVLIGMVTAVHNVGWQLPQLFTARSVSRQKRFLPMVLWLTIHERWPFLGLSLLALFVPSLTPLVALAIGYLLYAWHSVGAGVTATAWQSMIGKIMPETRRGTFFGVQFAGFSLLSAFGAFAAGKIIEAGYYPFNYALCFLLAGLSMIISWFFLAATREHESKPPATEMSRGDFWRSLPAVIRRDTSFRWFVIARSLGQFALVGLSFYAIFGSRRFALQADTIGTLTFVLLIAQTIMTPMSGWLGDRFGHRRMIFMGGVLFVASNTFGMIAPDANWLYAVFILAGLGNAAFITGFLSLTLSFGKVHERPTYISLSNTLVAPSTFLAPIIGGTLIDSINFEAMFVMATVAAVLMAFALWRSSQTRHDMNNTDNNLPIPVPNGRALA